MSLRFSLNFIFSCLWITNFISTFFFSQPAEASQTFWMKTPYLQFQLSNQWSCHREDNLAFTCYILSPSSTINALIIISAKEAGPEDSLASFQKYISLPKPIPSLQGVSKGVSVPQYVKNFNAYGQSWIEGVHLNSEIDGYYTRYLATVKERLSVLITFSAPKNKWKNYDADFRLAANTLQLTSQTQILRQPFTLGQNLQPNQNFKNARNPSSRSLTSSQTLPSSTQQGLPHQLILSILSVLVAGMVIYAYKS